MDKSREMKRSLNRPKKKLISGSEESRKEKKVRRLNIVAEMGSEGVAEEDEPMKFKFPRKIFGDSNTVDPASVPRKLRSAIRRRGCESGSVALPKMKRYNLLNGNEPPRMDCLKKSKICTNGCLDHSPKRTVLVPFSKDEEEVAATLFALASMIPLSVQKSMDDEASEVKASDMAEKHVPKEKQEVACFPSSEVAIATPMTDSLASNSEGKYLGPAPLTWPQLSESRPINLNFKLYVPPLNLQTIPPLLQTCDQRPSFDSAFFHTSIGPSTESGRNEIKQDKTFIPNSKLLIKRREVDVENQHGTLMERRFDDGGTSRAFHDSGVYGLKLQSSAINSPSRLSTDTLSSRIGTCDLSTKLSFSNRRTPWKRCAAHVYISHLIRVLQISEEKESQVQETRHLGQFRTLSCGLITADHFNCVRNKANGMLPNTNLFSSSDYKNFHDYANVRSVNLRHHQEQQESSSFSGYSGSKKQNFDFLSLSSGVTPTTDNSVNKLRNNLQSRANGHVLHQHSVAQDNRPQPFPSAQNHFPFNSYCDQVAPVSLGPLPPPPQGSLQIPQYFGHPFAPAYMFNATTSAQQTQSKHQQLQLQLQQQQQIWNAQLAAQFRFGPLLSPHITNWQKGRKDLRSSIYTESLNPSSQLSEELRAKYLHISQQQPQLISLGQSLVATKENHQHSSLPSIGEDNANHFRPNGVLPLQLTLQ